MKHLFRALAAFQQEVPVLHKGTKGYSYSYTDLPTIFRVINPLMQKHGLGFYQLVEGKSLSTTVFHVDSGEKISARAKIPENVELKGMNDFQVMGSAITYLRRYQLSAMLGLVTDKDTDAAGEPYDYMATASTGSYTSASSAASPVSSIRSNAASTGVKSVGRERAKAKDVTSGDDDGKIELKPKSVSWKRAVDFLLNQGSMEDIKKKFKLSSANERALLDEAGINQ